MSTQTGRKTHRMSEMCLYKNKVENILNDLFENVDPCTKNEFYLLSNTPAPFNQFSMDLFSCSIISRIQLVLCYQVIEKNFFMQFDRNIFIRIIL